jgi:hypothetical protein
MAAPRRTTAACRSGQSEESLLFRQEALGLDYTSCLRSVFLRERATSLPDGVVKFGESLESCDEDPDGVELRFAGGSIRPGASVPLSDHVR